MKARKAKTAHWYWHALKIGNWNVLQFSSHDLQQLAKTSPSASDKDKRRAREVRLLTEANAKRSRTEKKTLLPAIARHARRGKRDEGA